MSAKGEETDDRAHGWSRGLLDYPSLILGRRGLPHQRILPEVAALGGFMNRNRALEIVGRPKGSSLVGVITPIRTVVRHMREEGRLPWYAVEPLEAEYTGGSEYGWVIGYRMPPPLVLLLTDGS